MSHLNKTLFFLLTPLTVALSGEIIRSDIIEQGHLRDQETQMLIKNNKLVTTHLTRVIITSAGEALPEYVTSTGNLGCLVWRVFRDVSASERDKLAANISAKYLNKPLTEEELQSLEQDVEDFAKARGMMVTVRVLPEKINAQEGFITIDVSVAKLGKIEVIGNEYVSKDSLLRHFRHVQADEVIDTRKVEKAVSTINNRFWEKADVVFKPGEKTGTTDIELKVRDTRPLRVYAGSDNTGFAVTEGTRIYTGVDWGNFLFRDSTFSFKYSQAPNFHKFQSYKVAYEMPSFNQDLVNVDFSYTRMVANHPTIFRGVRKGDSYGSSVRYTMLIPSSNRILHKTNVGFDWKRANTLTTRRDDIDLITRGLRDIYVSSSLTSIFQLVAGYNASFQLGAHAFDAGLSAVAQPWALGESMTNVQYGRSRQGSSPYYMYMKMQGGYNWTSPLRLLGVSVKGEGQYTLGVPLSSEQFGLGGFATVRGYPEGVVKVDNAFVLRSEVKSPLLYFLSNILDLRSFKEQLSFLMFLDTAGGYVNQAAYPGARSAFVLAGFGSGIRYDVNPWIHARFDMGFPLTEGFTPAMLQKNQVYFSLVGSF